MSFDEVSPLNSCLTGNKTRTSKPMRDNPVLLVTSSDIVRHSNDGRCESPKMALNAPSSGVWAGSGKGQLWLFAVSGHESNVRIADVFRPRLQQTEWEMGQWRIRHFIRGPSAAFMPQFAIKRDRCSAISPGEHIDLAKLGIKGSRNLFGDTFDF